MLARQVQSCNTKLINLQNLSSKSKAKSLQNVKPFKTEKKSTSESKPSVSKVKQEEKATSSSKPPPSISVSKTTEPINRWVPKNN